MKLTAEVDDLAGQAVELMRRVEAGHEVVLTRGNRPVAKLVPATVADVAPAAPLRVTARKGHRVLTTVITQADLAEEMFR